MCWQLTSRVRWEDQYRSHNSQLNMKRQRRLRNATVSEQPLFISFYTLYYFKQLIFLLLTELHWCTFSKQSIFSSNSQQGSQWALFPGCFIHLFLTFLFNFFLFSLSLQKTWRLYHHIDGNTLLGHQKLWCHIVNCFVFHDSWDLYSSWLFYTSLWYIILNSYIFVY